MRNRRINRPLDDHSATLISRTAQIGGEGQYRVNHEFAAAVIGPYFKASAVLGEQNESACDGLIPCPGLLVDAGCLEAKLPSGRCQNQIAVRGDLDGLGPIEL